MRLDIVQIDNQLKLEIGDVKLQIACVVGHLPAAAGPVELLAWIGATFFVERPQTITPMQDGELGDMATGIVWTHQAGEDALWELRAWSGQGDPFEQLQELLTLRLLAIPQAAERLGVNRSLVTKLCRQGRIPGALKIKGHGWLIPEIGLELYEQGRR